MEHANMTEFAVPVVIPNTSEREISDTSDTENSKNKFNMNSFLKAASDQNNTVDLTNNSDAELTMTEKPFPWDSIRSSLTFRDLRSISQKKMLIDNVINVFQKIMARDFKLQIGLQDTVLAQKMKFKSIPSGEFVQILHDGKYHWVAISTYGCQQGKQCVTSLSLDQTHMRSHILHAILNDKLTAFPEAKQAKSRKMAECSQCGELYHQMCQRIPDEVFKMKKFVWLCEACRKDVDHL
eukprot:gene2333-2686_t